MTCRTGIIRPNRQWLATPRFLPRSVCPMAPRQNITRQAISWLGQLFLAGLLCGVPPLCSAAEVSPPGDSSPQEAGVGLASPDFSLPDIWGRTHRLGDYADAKIIVLAFLGTECPLVRLYGPRLDELAEQYGGRGVQVLGVNANCQDSTREIAAYVRRHEIGFPILKDVANQLADQLGAQRTPEVFVLGRDRRVRYRGRIDDQYGVGYVRDKPTRHDLRDALEDLLAGREVRHPHEPAAGCLIGRLPTARPDAEVTYGSDVARILRRHCVECHRDGEIAPFSLTSYEEVAGWAETIAEVIRDQRMPPWHANPAHGDFLNARLMSQRDKQLIYRWVAEGAAEGPPVELPEMQPLVQGWRLPREPDLVIPMRDRPFLVPAQGTVEYQYFVVDPGFEQDQWVAAAEVRPGNRKVVHHAIVFVRPPEGVEQAGVGWLSAYVPGNARMELPSDHARLIPAGSKLVFQLHYTPTGSVESDITRLGLVFADAARVRYEVMTLLALERDFEIPPHTPDYRVETALSDFPRQARLLSLGPHMHVRGKSFQFIAEPANGEPEILLDVPRYDFNWQHVYQLREPREIPADFKIRCIATFDNSENNLVNPDPSATVRWGDQTWEEMVLGYMEVAVPVESGTQAGLRTAQRAQRARALAEAKARRLIARFDQDQSGTLTRSELPQSFVIFAFRRMDENRDAMITLEEAVAWSLDSD